MHGCECECKCELCGIVICECDVYSPVPTCRFVTFVTQSPVTLLAFGAQAHVFEYT